jgi:Arc/MetJ family transcription regulator
MATNLKLDDALVCAALRISGKKSKREAVNQALQEYIDRKNQLKILELAGTIDYDPDYDYKEQRKRR